MKSIEEIYTPTGIFKDENSDGYSDKLAGYVFLRENSNITAKKVAVNLAGRIGYETMALDLPVVKLYSQMPLKGINIVVDADSTDGEIAETQAVIALKHEGESTVLYIRGGSEKALWYAGQYLYARLPYIWSVNSGENRLDDVKSRIKEKLAVLDVNILELVFDCRYQGIYSCKLRLECKNVQKVIQDIHQFSSELLSSYIGQLEFIVGEQKVAITSKPLTEYYENLAQVNNVQVRADTKFDLANLYTTRGLLVDTDKDFQSDRLNTMIVIPDNATDKEVLAASNIAARLGLESLGISFPLVCTQSELTDEIKNPIFVGNNMYSNEISANSLEDYGEIFIKYNQHNTSLNIIGGGNALVQAAECFAQNLPYLDKERVVHLDEIKNTIYNFMNPNSFMGQIVKTYADLTVRQGLQDKKLACYFDYWDTQALDKIVRFFSKRFSLKEMTIRSYKEAVTVWQKHFSIPWEVDTFRNTLEQQVFSRLKQGDNVAVFGVLSEEETVRNSLIQEIEDKIRTLTNKTGDIKIYCAYKQGLSWIMEDVVPRIKKLSIENKIASIIIRFKPFVKNEQVNWDDVDGALPNYTSHQVSTEEKWFDLPIRWLQELYPVDDLLARELGVSRNIVEFAINEDASYTYEIEVIDNNGCSIFGDTYQTCFAERPYLDEFPQIGKVHPPTGWIKVFINGKLAVDERIKTDMEEIWDVYQSVVLKKCQQYIMDKTGDCPSKEMQPLFKELKLDISASEPDYDLNIRQDMISALDALHEDIYFAGLDFFKTLGECTTGEGLTEPGLVLPCIRKRNGQQAEMAVTLSSEAYPSARFFVDNEENIISSNSEVELNVNRIILKNGSIKEVVIDTVVNGEIDAVGRNITAFSELYQAGIIDDMEINVPEQMVIHLNVSDQNKTITKECLIRFNKPLKRIEAKDDITDLDIPQDHVIGYDEYVRIVKAFHNQSGANVWKAGQSYQGRDIYAVDLTSEFTARLVSRAKLINAKPVYMLINRHHANEVSSTNSAFLLAQELLTKEENRRLLDKVNLTIIPFENVDGGNIHYDLQKQNPNWKLHVARYNAAGREFAWDYWKDSKYGESKVMPLVWMKWLPDMIVDNHGVPSHEWDQPFSGYVSPWFKGFWLPRALFYGYFWYINSPEYPLHKAINESVRDTVAQAINADEEIVSWNADWQDRFEKYAHKWLPKLFPADYHKNLIFYWIPYEPNESGRFASHRYPWITAVDWTTEVADETAQGDYLRLCSKTHFIADLAMIKKLSSIDIIVNDLSTECGGEITLKRVRQRPICIQ